MESNKITNINAYVVNELFNSKSSNYIGINNNSTIDTLQNLSEKYAEISAFGKKLNDIYTTLVNSGKATDNVLEGARKVILEFVNSQTANLNWMNTINAIDSLKNDSKLFTDFFSTANKISNANFNLGGWLESFAAVANYGFQSQFINQTSTILNNNSPLAASTFQSFLDKLTDITSTPATNNLTTQTLSSFFTGLSKLNTLQQKNSFITNFQVV